MSADVVLDPGAAEHLAREIHSLVAGFNNAVVTRRQHPTYGVSKASLRERVNVIEGALAAYGLLLGFQNHLGVSHPAAEALGIHLTHLRAKII